MENKNEIQKTQVFNVIILDRSGSMNRIRKAAVDGFNETLAGIKKAQEKFADTQDHFVTLVTFCSCEMNTVFNKVPVAEARPLRKKTMCLVAAHHFTMLWALRLMPCASM